MARITVRHEFDATYWRRRIAPGMGLRRHMEARGTATKAFAQMRLRAAPRRIDTGRLLNSIHIETRYGNHGPIVRIGSNVEYAIYVHNGTRPHRIVPRRAQVLAWQGPDGMVFARSVMHPGMAPNPFLADGLKAAMAQFR